MIAALLLVSTLALFPKEASSQTHVVEYGKGFAEGYQAGFEEGFGNGQLDDVKHQPYSLQSQEVSVAAVGRSADYERGFKEGRRRGYEEGYDRGYYSRSGFGAGFALGLLLGLIGVLIAHAIG